MITVNEDGSLISRFKVMVRPLKAIELEHRLSTGEEEADFCATSRQLLLRQTARRAFAERPLFDRLHRSWKS